jgi:hypothetical protein
MLWCHWQLSTVGCRGLAAARLLLLLPRLHRKCTLLLKVWWDRCSCSRSAAGCLLLPGFCCCQQHCCALRQAAAAVTSAPQETRTPLDGGGGPCCCPQSAAGCLLLPGWRCGCCLCCLSITAVSCNRLLLLPQLHPQRKQLQGACCWLAAAAAFAAPASKL